jgi:enoyl-CoA hydratase/carnithine racemase
MAERQYVKISIEDRIAILTIDHPPANAFNEQTVTDLDSAFDEVLANPEVKAIIITGAGQFAFVAGADVNEIKSQIDLARSGKPVKTDLIEKGQQLFNKIERCKKPVIAAINAVCLGGGNELAMACHMRIASDTARFGQPEVNLGVLPGWGGTVRLARIVGRGKAIELILTGDMIPAQEAARLNLVNKVVPAGQVVKTAVDLAKKLTAKSGLAMGAILESINHGMGTSIDEGLKMELAKFSYLCGTEDGFEGVSAFLQKRQAKFTDK